MDTAINIPLYHQLVDKLINSIQDKPYFEKLPSERELCNIYNVSRTTVRQALSELELSGHIIKMHGKGNFVAKPNESKQNLSNYYSFTKQTLSMGKTPHAQILEFTVDTPNKSLQEKMKLKKDDKLIRFIRLRLSDNEPMMLETTYIPYEKYSTLKKQDLIEKPLYDIFETVYDTKIFKVVEQFSAGNLTQKQAEYLKIPNGSACLKITRYSYDKKGTVIETTYSLARADQFIYETQINIGR